MPKDRSAEVVLLLWETVFLLLYICTVPELMGTNLTSVSISYINICVYAYIYVCVCKIQQK